jgi:hypothetical protein
VYVYINQLSFIEIKMFDSFSLKIRNKQTAELFTLKLVSNITLVSVVTVFVFAHERQSRIETN